MTGSRLMSSGSSGVGAQRIIAILGLASGAYCAMVGVMILLQRLGVPLDLMSGAITFWVCASIFVLSWFGKNMTSAPFFYGGQEADSSPLGLGSLNDWLSGAFLILFFSASLTGKIILAPSLMLGLLLQAALFAVAFHRTGVATLPGFFAWRNQSRLAGFIVLLVVAAILSLLIIAEFTVSVDIFTRITQIDPTKSLWFMLVLAVLPALIGGWSSFIIVNSVLAVWMLISVLAPAIVTGFFPDLLKAGLGLDVNGQVILPLQAIGEQALGLSGGSSNILLLLVTALVLSTGFSVLPHSLARLSLSKHQITALESLGWSALATFLVLSALPLSIGLIGANPSSSTLALLLKSQPVLHMLPYIALLFASFNALAVTMFALSSAVVRTLRRSRNLNPGEQSIFSTRLLVVLLSNSLAFLPSQFIPEPGTLLIMALSLSAGALFVPMTASIWLSSIPRTAITLAVVTGAVVVLSGVYLEYKELVIPGALGMGASAAVIIIGRIFSLFSKPKSPDIRLAELRQISVTT